MAKQRRPNSKPMSKSSRGAGPLPASVSGTRSSKRVKRRNGARSDTAGLLADETAEILSAPDKRAAAKDKKVAPSSKSQQRAVHEPTTEELAHEEALLAKEAEEAARRKKKRQPPGAGVDLMATYMDQLSHIPLYTPEQEIEQAKELEAFELTAWKLVLSHPKGVVHLHLEGGELEDAIQEDIAGLLESYRRAAQRTKGRTLKPTPARTRLVEALTPVLRTADSDNVMLDKVVQRMRREAWGRRVLDSNPAFRIGHNQVSEIEQACSGALRVRNNFVRANLRLVVSVARNFHHFRIPFIDLIQEGNVGLMKAVHRFDHRRGFRFSTYAHWWIRQSIERAIINKGSQVRLPVHVIDSRRQVGRAVAMLTQELERKPTAAEIAGRAELSQAKVEQILSGIQQDPVSLDESVGHDDPRSYLDLVRDEDNLSLDESVIRENTHQRVKELLHLLNPIEKDIIRRRFGLGDDSDQTLDEIGKQYNLSRERVRQIQAQGLMKMRRMCERRKIG